MWESCSSWKEPCPFSFFSCGRCCRCSRQIVAQPTRKLCGLQLAQNTPRAGAGAGEGEAAGEALAKLHRLSPSTRRVCSNCTFVCVCVLSRASFVTRQEGAGEGMGK